MERLVEYIKANRKGINIFDILDIIQEDHPVTLEMSEEDAIETIILASKYGGKIYDFQKVFEEIFRGVSVPFNFNWDNFADLAIGSVIEEMLQKWMSESQHFKLAAKETEVVRELMKYQFYRMIGSSKGLSKADMEFYFQKNEKYIRNMASFLIGLERTYITLVRIVTEG